MSFLASNDRILVSDTDGRVAFDTSRPMLYVIGTINIAETKLWSYTRADTANPASYKQDFAGTFATGISSEVRHCFCQFEISRPAPGGTPPWNTPIFNRAFSRTAMISIAIGAGAFSSFQGVRYADRISVYQSGSNIVWDAKCRQRRLYPDGTGVSSTFRQSSYDMWVRGKIILVGGHNV